MITVVAPILNEARSLKAWGHNVARFASQVVVYDMGSTDGSQEIIESFGFELHHHDTKAEPFVPYRWNEGRIRQRLVDWARNPWVLFQDADELWGPEFFAAKDELVKVRRPLIRFACYRFWLSPNLIRVRTTKSWHEWRRYYPGGRLNKMFRKAWVWYRESDGNHAPPRFLGLHKGVNRLVEAVRGDIPYYHFHLTDKGVENNAGKFQEAATCMTYFGPYPEEIEYYKDLTWLPSGRVQGLATTNGAPSASSTTFSGSARS